MTSNAPLPSHSTGGPPQRVFRGINPLASDILSPRQRIALAAGIALAHGLVFWWLVAGQPEPKAFVETTTTIVFIAPEAKPEPEPEPQPARLPATDEPEPQASLPDKARVPAQPTPTRAKQSPPASTPSPPAGDTVETIEIYDADGSIALPGDVAARLKAVDEGSLAFGFEQPGYLEDGAFMQRLPPLEYRATQFDKHWRPEHDLLTALLERAVAATSNEVEIPLAGGGKLLCKVSLLAMGGSCQMASTRTTVSLDDPATLSPEEDAQCAAWWDRLTRPGSQAEWKHTRAVYDFHCLKPREKNLDPPEPKVPRQTPG